MHSLHLMFLENGWDPNYIAFAGTFVSFVVLVAIYQYVNRDDFLD